jgi:hypothetical protein
VPDRAGDTWTWTALDAESKLIVASAMAAGVTDRLWEIADIAKLVEDAEAKPAKRGSYRKPID